MNNSGKWKIAAWFVVHTPIVVPYAVLIILGALYPFLAGCLVGCSKCHEWISSFIEVSIAVNSAMLVTDVRGWFVKKFQLYSKRFGSIAPSRIPVRRNDKTLARFRRKMKHLEQPLKQRLKATVRWFTRICFVSILIGCVLLLTDCSKDRCRLIPLLLYPFVLFYGFLLWHLCWALEKSRKWCREAIWEKAENEDIMKHIDTLDKAIPKSDSEEK